MTDLSGLIVERLRLQILWKSIRLLQGHLNLYTSHWHIHLSSGVWECSEYCILPYMNSLQVTNSSCFTLHLVWGSSHPPPCLFFGPCHPVFSPLHWSLRLSQPRWLVPPGAIMDLVLIACWRTEACPALPNGALPWEHSCLLVWLLW